MMARDSRDLVGMICGQLGMVAALNYYQCQVVGAVCVSSPGSLDNNTFDSWHGG